MIRFTRHRLTHSSGTGARQCGLLRLHLCRIAFAPTQGTRTIPVSRVLTLQKPPKWMPRPASRTFSLKNWPYGDGPV